MAERTKSREDAALEALFRTEPLPDDGFSERVMKRIRRRLWFRRLLVPAAVVLGGLIAVKPASTLLSMAVETLVQAGASTGPAMQLPSIVAALLPGAVLLAALTAVLRLLDD